MLEIINNTFGTIYERDFPVVDDGQFVEWRVKKTLKKLPQMMLGISSLPYSFSPEFKYYIDFLFKLKMFVIIDTDSEQIICKIPTDMLEISIPGLENIEAIKLMASKIAFIEPDIIRVINKFDLDCFLLLEDDESIPPGPEGVTMKSIRLISSVKLDNLHTNKKELINNH